jgi:hypothetical protein
LAEVAGQKALVLPQLLNQARLTVAVMAHQRDKRLQMLRLAAQAAAVLLDMVITKTPRAQLRREQVTATVVARDLQDLQLLAEAALEV